MHKWWLRTCLLTHTRVLASFCWIPVTRACSSFSSDPWYSSSNSINDWSSSQIWNARISHSFDPIYQYIYIYINITQWQDTSALQTSGNPSNHSADAQIHHLVPLEATTASLPTLSLSRNSGHGVMWPIFCWPSENTTIIWSAHNC